MRPNVIDAIRSLVGDDDLGGLTDSYFPKLKSGQTLPSKAKIDAELKKLQDEYDNDYKRLRSSEYPTIQECVHAILDDDLEELQKKRQAVKTKYPK